MITRIQAWLLTAGAVLLVLVGAYAAGGRAAKKAMELDRLRVDSTARRKRDEAVAKNDSLDDDAIRDLARQRMRDSSR